MAYINCEVSFCLSECARHCRAVLWSVRRWTWSVRGWGRGMLLTYPCGSCLTVRVVVKASLLQSWYQYHRLSHVTGPANNIKLLGLEATFLHWTMMKEVSECEASREESVVGGQGKGTVICTCKGKCDYKICKCFKAGCICSSACHHNNKKCTNHDLNDEDEE
jgi:hypothetical protein